jgi:hypothetical protein
LFICYNLMQESPTPTKLISSFTRGLSDSRRSKLTAEKHQAWLLFHLILNPTLLVFAILPSSDYCQIFLLRFYLCLLNLWDLDKVRRYHYWQQKKTPVLWFICRENLTDLFMNLLLSFLVSIFWFYHLTLSDWFG